MKIKILSNHQKINTMGLLDVADFGDGPEREVYLNGKRAPQIIEDALLEKLDREMGEYVDATLAEMLIASIVE